MSNSLLQSEENSHVYQPTDLVLVSRAAQIVDRNNAVIRNWIATGKIQTWKIKGKAHVSLGQVKELDLVSWRHEESANTSLLDYALDRQRQIAECQFILDGYRRKEERRNAPNYNKTGLVGGTVYSLTHG